jgi:hypothetical protein
MASRKTSTKDVGEKKESRLHPGLSLMSGLRRHAKAVAIRGNSVGGTDGWSNSHTGIRW